MPRVKFRPGPIPIDKFEGMQVIIHVEKVNMDLQEILCTVIAHNSNGTMANAPGVIELKRDIDFKVVSETIVPYKDPETQAREELLKLIEAIENHKIVMGVDYGKRDW